TEETGLPYASAIPGAMHACGHDLHTAMLAGAAKLLSARQAEVPGTVIFMFQPGEEGYAGARYMIGEGVLDAAGERPGAAYAPHVSGNKLPCGMFSTRPGPMLAAADQIRVTVHGRGGPAFQAHPAPPPHPAGARGGRPPLKPGPPAPGAAGPFPSRSGPPTRSRPRARW